MGWICLDLWDCFGAVGRVDCVDDERQACVPLLLYQYLVGESGVDTLFSFGLRYLAARGVVATLADAIPIDVVSSSSAAAVVVTCRIRIPYVGMCGQPL